MIQCEDAWIVGE